MSQVERYGSEASPRGALKAGSSWTRQPVIATAIRVLGLALPMAAGCVAAIIASRMLPHTESTPLVVLRTLTVIAASMATIALADFAFRRCLPLATLFQLSLVFPDQAPSRFRLAVQAGSSRRIKRLLAETREHGLDDDPQRAAEQVLVMVGAIGQHDRRTRGHSERVRVYADLIGKELHLTSEERQMLQWAALLHDVGKLDVPHEILNSKEPLTGQQWTVMRRHPETGRTLIRPLSPFLGEWAEGVWNHHEHWDGSGYPRNLSGERIGRSAAIIAVADAFEVMTTPRPYRKALTMAEARAEITNCAGTQFSPEAVRAFLSIGLRHLRFAMGPLSALTHVPLLRKVAELPTMGSGAMSAAVTAAAPTAIVGVLAVGGLHAAGAIDVTPLEEPPATVVAADKEDSGPSTTTAPRRPTTRPSTTGSTTSSTTGSTTSTTTGSTTTAPNGSTTSTTTGSTTTAPNGSTTSTTTTGSTTTTAPTTTRAASTTTTTGSTTTTTAPTTTQPEGSSTTTTTTTRTTMPPVSLRG